MFVSVDNLIEQRIILSDVSESMIFQMTDVEPEVHIIRLTQIVGQLEIGIEDLTAHDIFRVLEAKHPTG